MKYYSRVKRISCAVQLMIRSEFVNASWKRIYLLFPGYLKEQCYLFESTVLMHGEVHSNNVLQIENLVKNGTFEMLILDQKVQFF